MTFAQENIVLSDSRPLTIIGRGKYGGNVNLDAYKAKLVPFVYGIVPAFNPIPFLTRKKTHQEMPTLDEVNRTLKLKR